LKPVFIISFLLFATCQFAFGQNRKLMDDELNNSTVTKFKFADTTCAEIDGWLKSDIKNHSIFLFLQGGIAPVIYPKDTVFENKYGVYFYDFGCISPGYECVIKYNEGVFEYLTNAYGKKWMKKIRKDIIGFSQWKAKEK
jgi:hypothetical protein